MEGGDTKAKEISLEEVEELNPNMKLPRQVEESRQEQKVEDQSRQTQFERVRLALFDTLTTHNFVQLTQSLAFKIF